MKKGIAKRGLMLMAVGVLALAIAATPVKAEEGRTYDHSVGLSYLSGFSDIIDFYDETFYVDGDGGAPVGLAYNFTTNFPSGMRIDAGVGPFAIIAGDLEYYDLPIRLQGGFTIGPKSSVRPYLKAGFSYHFSDGDYVRDEAGLGLLGTIGVEFGQRGRFSGFFEVSHDTAEATFDSSISGPMGYYKKKNMREDIKVNGTVVSVGVVF